MKRIGVLTGGGDAPGLNAAIKSVVYRAQDFGVETIGVLDGWRGLLDGYADQTLTLDYLAVRPWDRDGGTNLGSSRTNPFNVKRGGQTLDLSAEVIGNMESLGLDGLVAMGGEDTLGVAARLHEQGVPVVGVPKTIDKDLLGTDYTLGFDTAMSTCQEIIERCRTPAGSHHWIQVVEIMGRHAGHLAFWSGVGGGAFVILVPEYRFSLEHLGELLTSRMERSKLNRDYPRYAVIVVAEGASPTSEGLVTVSDEKDAFGHVKLGGIGDKIAHWIRTETPCEARSVVPAHAQRGGPPGPVDRLMGVLYGSAAVDLLVSGRAGEMVSSEGVAPACKIGHVPLQVVTEGLNLLDVDRYYDKERLNVKRSFFAEVLAAE
jgi:6-phosphofructokinase 1